MKTPRFPLYAKILLWFFLNLLVLGAAAVIALSFQFPLGPELLVSGPAGQRVQALTGVIRDEINSESRTNWDATLDRFGKSYQISILLYRNDGTHVAGKSIALPNEVNRRLMDGRGGPRRGPGPPDGESFRDGPPRERFGYPPPEGRERLPDGAAPIRFVTRTYDPKRYWIGVAMPIPERAGRGPGTLILVSQSVRAGGLLMDFSLWIWVGLGAVTFSVLFWLPLVRSITRSLAQMNLATAQIAEGDFNVRLNQHRRDELGSLGGGINRMAARLAGFVTGQKRFLGDIAHELCSPIARMQMALGILEERASEKEKAYVEDVREEVQHMSGLVNELLSFSKAALGANKARLESVALRPLVEKAIKREARDGAELHNEVPAELNVVAEPELIVRATSNLVRNALRYAGEAGPITVSAQRLNEIVELVVSDHGPGVPESELSKLFDPFYRVDTSRTRETGGAGLGLSIVKTCVETCRGTVICRNRQPHGLEVVIRLNATPTTV